jgi:hypothetical protein
MQNNLQSREIQLVQTAPSRWLITGEQEETMVVGLMANNGLVIS